MTKPTEMRFMQVLMQRHSVKAFDPEVKIPREEMEELLRLAQLAPSSINLQPWRFVVVDSEAGKAKLKGLVRFNEVQRETSAAMVLVLADQRYFDLADTILTQSVEEGLMPEEVKNHYLAFIQQAKNAVTEQYIREQALMDASLAAMQFMLVAKSQGYDTNAIGGFERQAVLDALHIDAQRYAPVMFIAIGKGAKPHHPSSRLPLDYTVSWNDGLGFKQP